MSSKIGLSSRCARSKAPSDHGCQCTGWCAAERRYALLSVAKRFALMGSLFMPNHARRLPSLHVCTGAPVDCISLHCVDWEDREDREDCADHRSVYQPGCCDFACCSTKFSRRLAT